MLRHLTARRLARSERWDEARTFFPPEPGKTFEEFLAALEAGRDRDRPPRQRAAALFRSARLLEDQGLEIFGTELDPDVAILDGRFPPSDSLVQRIEAFAREGGVLAPTREEIRRVVATAPEPNRRFHYRYRAADLAWEAAELLPDGEPRTVRILCIAGSWHKYDDPELADRFYKAMVRRGRGVPLAEEADERRWFPEDCEIVVP